MTDIFLTPLLDSLAMVPWLFGIYIALEFVERRYEHLITGRLHRAMRAGPLLGALFGCIPQCGFSVIASALYAQRVISLGTLLAVFLSTSDEAIPVILAQSNHWGTVVWILLTKVIIATAAGYMIDLFSRTPIPKKEKEPHDPVVCETDHSHCCGRDHSCREPWWRSFVLFPLKHALKVFLFIFLVSLGIHLIVLRFGAENLSRVFLANTFFQPVLTVLIGLLPNCAASVAITEIYLKGGISFGSAIAGLCAGAGLGLLVLFQENKNFSENLRIIGLLAGVSLLAGLVLNFL